MSAWFPAFACSVGAGVVSAWGVGGGTLLLLAMTLFLGVEQKEAQAINLLFFLPAAAAALLCHKKSGALDAETLRRAVPAALIAALAGSLLSGVFDAEALRRPFGVYLLLSALIPLFSRKKSPP